MATSAWRSADESVGRSKGLFVVGAVGLGAILAVISASWLSSDVVVRASGRERFRFTVRWKARRSCLRWAVRAEAGLLRMALAWEMSDCRAILVSFSGTATSGGGSDLGVGGSLGSDSDSDSLAAAFCEALAARSLRPAARSALSFRAPVAKRTRSGSTWNMSPGFSW